MTGVRSILRKKPDSSGNREKDNDDGVDDEEEDVEHDGIVVDDGTEQRDDASGPVRGIHCEEWN